jgi:hypothetical protein
LHLVISQNGSIIKENIFKFFKNTFKKKLNQNGSKTLETKNDEAIEYSEEEEDKVEL